MIEDQLNEIKEEGRIRVRKPAAHHPITKIEALRFKMELQTRNLGLV